VEWRAAEVWRRQQWKSSRSLGFRAKAAAAASENLGHEGGSFIGRSRRLGVRSRGPRGKDGTGCRPDSNSSPSLARGEDDPDRWGSPVSEKRGKGRGSRQRGGERKEELGWTYTGEEKGKKEGRLGRAG
jgi:hypothetical protein